MAQLQSGCMTGQGQELPPRKGNSLGWRQLDTISRGFGRPNIGTNNTFGSMEENDTGCSIFLFYFFRACLDTRVTCEGCVHFPALPAA